MAHLPACIGSLCATVLGGCLLNIDFFVLLMAHNHSEKNGRLYIVLFIILCIIV